MNGYEAWRNALGPILQRRGGRLIYGKNPMSGFPDISGLLKNPKGRFFACEIKSDLGKLSPKQKIRLKTLEDNGAFCMAVRSLADMIQLINQEETNYVQICTPCRNHHSERLESEE